mmetsp:Transcript_28087/g.48077  ORF Transcript_28087/g.48077 Transcript_28087/m.48077 type:complete len:290 (-) Transcript_28087:331-1200(-)
MIDVAVVVLVVIVCGLPRICLVCVERTKGGTVLVHHGTQLGLQTGTLGGQALRHFLEGRQQAQESGSQVLQIDERTLHGHDSHVREERTAQEQNENGACLERAEQQGQHGVGDPEDGHGGQRENDLLGQKHISGGKLDSGGLEVLLGLAVGPVVGGDPHGEVEDQRGDGGEGEDDQAVQEDVQHFGVAQLQVRVLQLVVTQTPLVQGILVILNLGQHTLDVTGKSGVFVALFEKLVAFRESSGQVLLVLGAHARGTALVQASNSVHQLQIAVVVRRDNHTAHTFLHLRQ